MSTSKRPLPSSTLPCLFSLSVSLSLSFPLPSYSSFPPFLAAAAVPTPAPTVVTTDASIRFTELCTQRGTLTYMLCRLLTPINI